MWMSTAASDQPLRIVFSMPPHRLVGILDGRVALLRRVKPLAINVDLRAELEWSESTFLKIISVISTQGARNSHMWPEDGLH